MIINLIDTPQMKKMLLSLFAILFLTVTLSAQSEKKVDPFGNVISDSKFVIYPDSGGKLKIIRPDTSVFPLHKTKLDPAILVVIDGNIYATGLKWINPEIIKSVSVLKDEEAEKIYGNLGKKGALLITTR